MVSGEGFEGREGGGSIREKLGGYESPVLPETLLAGARRGNCRVEWEDADGDGSISKDGESSINGVSSSSPRGS
jgi:hypothetical protein